ncbi:PAS domain S-box protein [Archangium violaceum]|uniref:PAS domain S-box protein n=1 Tax=Archangium violaceum TaxID=83451 RepID=UPI00193C2FB6|nr:PAS domain S-box protein [Archangium violaceum]QRK12759.1 PAS domain S-box protein [Archangium violaceum]
MRALLADTRRLVWAVDEMGRMQEPSPSWAAFTGQPPEQMRDRRWMEPIHPDDQGKLEPGGSAFTSAHATGEELACRVRGADGTWRELHVRALPVKDDAGRRVEWLLVAEDVTERANDRQEQAEKALHESEERFRSLVQTSTAAVWTTDAQGVPVEDSPSWRAFTGYTLDKWLDGTAWMESIHPEDRVRVEAVWRNCLATKTPYEVESRVWHANGSWRWVRARAVPVFNLDGTVREWVGTTTDISEHKIAEEERNILLAELMSKERLLSAVLEQMPSGFLLAGPRGELTFANAQVQALSGHPLFAPETERGAAAYHYHRLDGTEYSPEELPLSRSLRHGEVVRGEVLWLHGKDNKDNRFIRVNCAPIRDERGQTIAAVAILDNITEARRAEERAARLQSATSALSQALTPGDVARTILTEALGGMDANAGAVYRRRADGLLEVLYDVGYPESYIGKYRLVSPDADTPVTNAVRTGRESWLRSNATLSERYPDVAAARPEVNDHAAVTLPMWVHGQPIGAIVLSLNDPRTCGPEEMQFLRMLAQQCGQALERARLYEVAETERQRAEQASRLKDDFLGVLSHELRTPLTAILGWTQILRTWELAPEKRERALETIERNARAQTQLVEDLLDVNRIVSGKLRLDVRPTHLTRVIENALDVVRPAAEAKGLQLQTRMDPQTPPLLVDPDRLQQVVWNLVSNAVKFTPQGGRVTVSLAQGSSHVELQVSDTGDGLAANFLPHLFERFRQADASSTRRYGGLGLGLSIVRHLVELHGGTIEAQSPGKGLGATFIVRLPRKAPRPDVAEPVRATTPPPPSLPVDYPQELRERHILVVDDDADARELIATMLREGGARVSTAVSAAGALELLGQEPPELLISDIGMPEMDGYALMREVRGRPPEQGGRVRSLALTAYAREEDQYAARLAGFDAHVAKPLEPSELLRVAASLLRRSE